MAAMYTDGVWNAMKIKKRTQPVSIPTCFLTIWESEKAIGRNIQVRGVGIFKYWGDMFM